MKWLRWFAGIFVALAGMFFFMRAGSHRKKQRKLERKIADKQQQAGAYAEKARSEHEKAEAAKLRALAAVSEGQARVKKLKESGNEDLAKRVDDFNRRLRQRRGS